MDLIWIKFFIGLLLLLFSTHSFVMLAEKISQRFKISPLVVGITVVALGTSLPELTVSIVSILKNDTGLAMGNIIGSNIVNVLMVFPVGILMGNLRIGSTKTQRNIWLLLGATMLFFLAGNSGEYRRLFGFILIVLSFLVSFIEYRLAVSGRLHEDKKSFITSKGGDLGVTQFFIGILLIAGIIYGGLLVVTSVEAISLVTGISTTVLGLTLTAVATSLPELLTTVFSQKDHQEKLTVGNLIGSNIYNLLLIGGLIFLFPSNGIVTYAEWLWLALATGAFVSILRHYRGVKPPKYLGLILLFIFLIYIVTQ